MFASNQLTGKRLKITGRWNGKYVDVSRIKQRDGKKDPRTGRVEGRIDTLSREKGAFVVGPVVVRYTEETKYSGLSREKLAKGVDVEVTGRIERAGLLIAESIEPGATTHDYIEMLGAVTASKQTPNGDVRAKILGVPVRMPQDVFDRGLSLIRNPDDKRPDKQLTVQLWGNPLVIGGEVGSNLKFRGDYELDDEEQDDLARLDQGLELEFFYRPSKNTAIFAEAKSSREQVVYDEEREGGLESRIRRGEMWAYAGRLFGTGLAVQVGRQSFRENREWWWDEDLDAARVYYIGRRVFGEFAIARELPGLHFDSEIADADEEDILRYIGRFSIAYHRDHRLDFFYLQQKDRSGWQIPINSPGFEPDDPTDADLIWRGLRLTGELDFGFAGDMAYWIDTAQLTGSESYFDKDTYANALDTGAENGDDGSSDDDEFGNNTFAAPPGVRKRTISAWAFDVGFSLETELPFEPTLSLSYAVGSGDKGSNPAKDGAFRQTELHDNNTKYSGVDRFRYYGELFRPDLSNIHIYTVSVGFPFWRSSSVELLFHKYRQFSLSTSRNSRLKAKPAGVSKDLGEEFNLVIGLEKWKHLEIEIIGGLFRAGRAYGLLSGELAYNSIVKFDFNF
ncbi:MAG: alginate export family protein [bacterium]